MNIDLNEIQSPAKAAVSAVVEKKPTVVSSAKPPSSAFNSASALNSAYLKKTSNDENIPPSNFNQLPFI
jgi:hypothetical protein